MTRKSTDTYFGSSVSAILTERGLSQEGLARKIKKNTHYVNHTMTGYRKPAPEYVDLVANTLKLDDEARAKLHRAAALDNGFKLDLNK